MMDQGFDDEYSYDPAQIEPALREAADTCPGCAHEGHTGWCPCGCLDDRVNR